MSGKKTIVGFGEALWDMFEDGPRFGGAPANFACTAAGLAGNSAEVLLASAVGRDELGERAIEELKARGVDVSCVALENAPTGQVFVRLNDHGQAEYEFLDNVAWDQIPYSDQLQNLAQRADAVCYGSLAQRCELSQRTLLRFLAAIRPACLRVFDINLRTPFWTLPVLLESLESANVLKLNDQELPVLAEHFDLKGTIEDQLRELQKRYSLRMIAFTLGQQGSILLNETRIDVQPSALITVVDTVGAGDAFTAALTLGMLADRPLGEIHRLAATVAGYVCTQAGATPHFTPEIRGMFNFA